MLGSEILIDSLKVQRAFGVLNFGERTMHVFEPVQKNIGARDVFDRPANTAHICVPHRCLSHIGS